MRLRRLRLPLATLAVLATVGGYSAYAAGGSGADFRTARTEFGDVEQSVSLAGTLAPEGRFDLAFAASGTVADVTVGVGDLVSAGQVLARLDRTSLRAAVKRARADLAAARAQLESDQDAQSETVTAGGSSTGSDGSTGSTGEQDEQDERSTEQESEEPTEKPTDQDDTGQEERQAAAVDPALTAALATLAEQQDAVTSAQSAASSAIAAATDALAAQSNACAEAYASPDTGDRTGDDTGPASGDLSATPSEGSGGEGSGGASEADQVCQDALAAVQAAQDEVAESQDTLQDALEDLSGTLADAVAALQRTSQAQADTETSGSASTSDTPSASSSAGSDSAGSGKPDTTGQAGSDSAGDATAPTAGNGNAAGAETPTAKETTDTTGGSSGTRAVTAATLAADQAAIDGARADLLQARAELSGALIRAPYAGTVASVAISEDGAASAGTTAVVVVAPGATNVELAVSDTQVTELAVGQRAEVTPAGAATSYTGTVSRIGELPDTSTGTTTYPVTVTLDQSGLMLPAGATASVSVVVGSASGVLTIPSSAVSGGSVTVLDGDGETTRRVRVTTGLVGPARTEVTDGLAEGDRVVLADLDLAVPTGDTGSGAGGIGGIPGAGVPGGGAPVVRMGAR